jgi:7-cyano-7-deazaguanine synthase in queuosine biosynthesis
MSKLIFFSGGVESTALLNDADPMEDVLVTVLPTFPRDIVTSKLQSAQAIAQRFGFTMNYAQIQVPVEPDPYNFVHQARTFLSVANLWVAKDTRITELWFGRCKEDINPPSRPVNIVEAWNLLYPDIPWTRPLEHVSKWDQWKSIPLDVQPLVSSCVVYNNCGKCYKCQEVQKLIIQHA